MIKIQIQKSKIKTFLNNKNEKKLIKTKDIVRHNKIKEFR